MLQKTWNDVANVCHVHVQVTRQFAMLHAKDGIRINSVNPGYVLTDVYGEGTPNSPVALFKRQPLWLCCIVHASISSIYS